MGRKMTLEEVRQKMDCGNLVIDDPSITELPDDLVIEGTLDLDKSNVCKLPKNLTVLGELYINYTSISEIPKNLKVGMSLILNATNITTLPEDIIIGGSLFANDSNLVSLPDNLIIGGNLDIRNTKISKLPENLVVGGWIDMTNTEIHDKPESILIGGDIYHNMHLSYKSYVNYAIIDEDNPWKQKHTLHNGDYVPGKYLYVDNMLTHIKSEKKIGKYTYYIGKLDTDVIYDGEYYAHCRSFKEGIRALAFKHSHYRWVNQYKNIGIDQPVPFEDAITMYRVITGACKLGTEKFLETFYADKSEYTPREIIEITDGEYGNETFKDFFMNR